MSVEVAHLCHQSWSVHDAELGPHGVNNCQTVTYMSHTPRPAVTRTGLQRPRTRQLKLGAPSPRKRRLDERRGGGFSLLNSESYIPTCSRYINDSIKCAKNTPVEQSFTMLGKLEDGWRPGASLRICSAGRPAAEDTAAGFLF